MNIELTEEKRKSARRLLAQIEDGTINPSAKRANRHSLMSSSNPVKRTGAKLADDPENRYALVVYSRDAAEAGRNRIRSLSAGSLNASLGPLYRTETRFALVVYRGQPRPVGDGAGFQNSTPMLSVDRSGNIHRTRAMSNMQRRKRSASITSIVSTGSEEGDSSGDSRLTEGSSDDEPLDPRTGVDSALALPSDERDPVPGEECSMASLTRMIERAAGGIDPIAIVPLAPELLEMYFGYFDAGTLCRAEEVSQGWKKWAAKTRFWQALCRNKWNVDINALQMPDSLYRHPKRLYEFHHSRWRSIREAEQARERVWSVSAVLQIPEDVAHSILLLSDA
jgi:hypothetical protein